MFKNRKSMLTPHFLDRIALCRLLPLESLFPEVLLSLEDVSDLYLQKGVQAVLSCFPLQLDEPWFPSPQLVYGAFGTSLTILGFLFPRQSSKTLCNHQHTFRELGLFSQFYFLLAVESRNILHHLTPLIFQLLKGIIPFTRPNDK